MLVVHDIFSLVESKWDQGNFKISASFLLIHVGYDTSSYVFLLTEHASPHFG